MPAKASTSRRIAIVGLGGLGSPAALALAALDIADLVLIDADHIDVTNLHRQLLYRTQDVGRPKAEVAVQRLSALFPSARIDGVSVRADATNLSTLLQGVDFIIDGTDLADSKFLLNDAAVRAGIPLSYAGVVGWRGQTMTILPRQSPCLRCLFPEPLTDEDAPTCQAAGVVGALVGCFGAIQATEAIKYLRGQYSDLLAGRLLTCDLRAGLWREVRLSQRPDCALCGQAPTDGIHSSPD